MRTHLVRLVAVLLVAGVPVGCASDDDASGDVAGRVTSGNASDATPQPVHPDGPAAVFEGPLEGGGGTALVAAGAGPALAGRYVEAEFSAAGTATSYASAGELPVDGTFALEPAEEAAFATRVLVRRPEEPAAFNGTVVVEWLNVSGGADTAAEYTYLAEELLRGGYAWVGVSAQRIGIEGGPVAVQVPGAEAAGLGRGLRAQDPDRYGRLHHPGDAFSYDIYTQVARALREPAGVDVLGGLGAKRLLAVGESQSAFALTTYVNGVQPLTGAYDGFLIHSRGGAAAPLGAAGTGIDIAGTLGGAPTQIRTDGEAPVIIVQTETDVLGLLGYLPARQPDDDRLRLWEVAGTAHADAFQLGAAEAALGCPKPVNRGQQVFVLRAALRHLDTWVSIGTPAPGAPRLAVDESGASPSFVLDEVGNVEGGIRTPVVEAPVDVLSGMPAEGSSVICLLMGSTTPLDADQLGDRHASRAAYLEAYERATDEVIDARFALADDREELLAGADPSRLPD